MFGLLEGLQSRGHLQPLRKLSLKLCGYEMRDFQLLFDAIFSLPQLENLELVFGKELEDLLQQPEYDLTLFRSWSAAGVQLKSVSLPTKFEYLNLLHVTQDPKRQFCACSCRYRY